MKPHKHAELIKAWADGAEIEIKQFTGSWVISPRPSWDDACQYRIKPEPKPDIVYYGAFDVNGLIAIDSCFTKYHDEGDHIKVTFDGETGKLKSAEVL